MQLMVEILLEAATFTVSAELQSTKDLKRKLEVLSTGYEQLQDSLATKEQEISELKGALLKCSQQLNMKADGKTSPTFQAMQSSGSEKERVNKAESIDRTFPLEYFALNKQVEIPLTSEEANLLSMSPTKPSRVLKETFLDGVVEDELLEIPIESQESFSGHTSPISRCRFSAGGGNIASASVDGTVRIWNSDPGSSTSRNATIYCGAEVLSLEWDFKSDRLLLIGTAERGIKAWNVDAKRVVCDFTTEIAFPRILDLKCSPAEPIFASAASSTGYRGHNFESKGFASLTLWNMKTWKPLTVLPLGEDPPTITSICFNHNGRMLAAGATDGLIHIFDTYGRLPITGWPAHDSAVSCVKFGPDQASIFSLGADGKVFEWSLHNQGQVLQEQDASMFCRVNEVAVPRHEMALDVRGNMLLLTSNCLTSPVYQKQQIPGWHSDTKGKLQTVFMHGVSLGPRILNLGSYYCFEHEIPDSSWLPASLCGVYGSLAACIFWVESLLPMLLP
ncbi:hypothetical protein GOP47_0007700 [Adiantum capillus-veneris]|uniref:Anaphase-promoting complex subunit 4-like WD40 domain-containing protein n=1 Tax=Adiantum capillus-veneris TaxID=13818 RepID=A0A9D4ZLS4_ADICA|nr:hypothetical protein GOP47_0007700 [Adiantum capillus-veneris]